MRWNRWRTPPELLAAADLARASGIGARALPAAYHVLDRAGAVLLETTDGHDAWRVLCDDPRARAKVDAADHSVVYAHRRQGAMGGSQ